MHFWQNLVSHETDLAPGANEFDTCVLEYTEI